MGLKEIEMCNNNNNNNNNSRWNHPPKKKWIHCYLSVGDEKKSEASELRTGIVVDGSPAPLAVSFTPPHPSVTTTVCPLDRRGLSVPSADDRHMLHRRRGGHYSPSAANGRTSPILSPSFSLSPSLLSSSSSSSLDSPLGLVNTFKSNSSNNNNNNNNGDSSDSGCQPTLSHLSLDSAANARIQTNGFLRPNGLSKPHSPLSRALRQGEVHNKLEKNRRAHLKECFETLRRQLPCMEDKKISNQTILKAAHRYIQRKEREYENEMEKLARQKIQYQQHLSALKKELQAKWEHIDIAKILPDMASLEQNRERDTKSTTTASEQPDFEDDSLDSSAHSNSLTLTSSPELKNGASSQPVDLTPSPNSECLSYITTTTPREQYQDPNQPLNLSTSTLEFQKSAIRASQQRINGEWPLRRNSHYSVSPYANEDKISVAKPLVGRIHSPRSGGNIQMAKLSSTSPHSVNVGRNNTSNLSTNLSHISTISVKGQVPTSCSTNTTSSHATHLVKPGSSVSSHLSSMTNIVTTFPNLTSAAQSGPSLQNHPCSNVGGNAQAISSVSSTQDNNIQTVPSTMALSTHVPHLSTIGTTIARVSMTAACSSSNNNSVTVASQEHPLPIVGGNGIPIPAQLVTGGVHISSSQGTILSQPTIQVITPEGCKLLPAEHTQNGTKSLAFTLTHPGGLEHLSTGEDGKTGPVMVAMSKNGLSALHVTVPASGRTLTSTIGTPVPVTSVPLNLTVGGSATAVKVSQSGTTSIIPSYLPLTHANGITQLVQGMSLVGPLVVSQSQRGIVVPAGGAAGKGVKTQGVSGNGGTNVPLVPAHYASTIAGGLVNSVVVVSAPTVVAQSGPISSTASAVTSSGAVQSAKH
ncbi:Max-binding protein MNT [Armadillidium vulgare]|nr:Max-binding protein MNT [Armadillidium vulgare]